MSYYIDASRIRLDDVRKRIEETDLIPSRMPLLEGIQENFKKLHTVGISSLEDLRKAIKSAKNIPVFSKKANIDIEYLTLLRREIEGYFPKASPLSSFDWLPAAEISKLEHSGFNNTVLLFEELSSPKKKLALGASQKISSQLLDTLYSLLDLTRIQWTSPTTARMLLAAGYDRAKKVSEADPQELYSSLAKVNKENNFYNGTIGLRDVGRLIKAASNICEHRKGR